MKPYYYSLNEYLKEQYGHKIYKLALNSGMTCPNRDGLIDFRGCIFCSAGGSGDFATGLCDFDKAKEIIKDKYSGNDFIAYFQSFTNTYAPVSYLEQLYMPIIKRDDVRILSIATRPDCLYDECIELLDKLNKIKPVWIELGLQTIHERTARYIRRGYSLDVFENAVSRLNKIGIRPIVHMIIGLPGESHDEILQTAAYLSHMNISGIKLQLLHVLKNTDLATDYNNGCFKVLELDEYISIVADILQILPADMIIHRITGDGPKNLLIAPLWSANKKNVLNSLNRYLRDNNIIQGSKFNLINNKEE